MSAQTRSHHRPPIHQDAAAPSRIPMKAGTIERGSSKSTQNISRVPRKPVGGAPTSDHAVHSRKGNTGTASVPVTAARLDPIVTQGISVPPSSEAPTAARYPRRTSYGTILQPPSTMKTPSLVSGSSARTSDSPRSHGLRRKPSTIDSYTSQMRARGPRIEADRATMHSRSEGYNDALEDAVLGISLPPTGKPEYRDSYLRSAAPARLLPNLDTQNTAPIRDITPPVPGLSHSATPSTRCTDSPYSHVPTPNSASSYHSGVAAPVTENPKKPSNSPLRPRPTPPPKDIPEDSNIRKTLPHVYESSTSSSRSTLKPKHNKSSGNGPNGLESAPSSRQLKSSGQSRLPAPDKKSMDPTQTAQSAVQIPPELAHLNVDAPANPRMSTTLPPRRPSRSRTPSLTNVNNPSPVVHSDLPRLYTTYHKRTPSQDTNGSATSTSLRSRFGFSPRSSSKQGSPRVDSAFSPSPSSKKHKQPPTPDSAVSDRPRLLRKDSPAFNQPPSPAPSKSPRFSFLSRKSKNNVDKATEKPKREPRKGPVAGTGHEKYARFGFRGRSNSATGSQPFSRSPSADSSASGAPKQGTSRKGSTTSEDNSDMDEFLRERLNPVVIRGRGVSFGNRTEVWATKDEESSSSQSTEHLPEPQLLPSAMSTGHQPPVPDPQSRNKGKLKDSDVDKVSGSPEPAVQRSLEGGREDASRIPPPIDTNVTSQASSLDSYEADSSAYPPTDSTTPPPQESHEGKEGLWLRPLKKEQPAPRLKHKWNFFQRAQSSQQTTNALENSNEPLETPFRPYQDAMHLGILDAVEPIELSEVERIIHDHETSTSGSSTSTKRHSRMLSSESRHANLWPSPANAPFRVSDSSDARRLSPSVMANQILTESPELLQARAAVSKQPGQVVRMKTAPFTGPQFDAPTEQPPQAIQSVATPELVHESGDTPDTPRSDDIVRQSRLSPVGRIPLVVSKRDRDRRLPDNSFSRPFVSNQPRPTVRPPGSLYNQIRDLASYVDTASQPVSSTSTRSDSTSAANQSSINMDQPSTSTNRSSFEFYAGSDFITFAPRKNSELTYSSSSSGASNWMAAHAQDDDIWNEYNDLMDDVLPEKTPISAGSSLGAPFQYANMPHDSHSPAMPAPLKVERSGLQQPSDTLPLPPAMPDSRDSFASYRQNPPVSPMAPEEHEAVALAEMQQDDRFTSRPVSPLTPDTLARFVGTYGDRSTASSFTQNRLSVPQAHMYGMPMHRASTSSRHSRGSRHSRSASLPEANARNSQISMTPSARFNRDTQLLDIQERETDQKSPTANLRFGALMTSKWLSFGRILFSDAHNEVRLADEPRVLVVDGLGDDWSHYVAASYPNAVVCNLSISKSNASDPKDWESLPNYRHYNHTSLSAPFPFPKGFFTAVVFRFPVAATEHTYQACVLECKRVLRPGGHLEVVALDIDMINMGTRGRKALRGLKTRMQQRDQDVSLRNLSDGLVRMIGRRGFEDVQRCIVGVPTAGRIPRSDDLRSSSCSSNSTNGRLGRSDSSSTDSQDRDLSFSMLLQSNRNSQLVGPGRANDEGITKMVARVGRWWYSACYEQQLLKTDKSIWREPGLLRECEKQGTSFRLLICCAQKPLQTRRRTVSV